MKSAKIKSLLVGGLCISVLSGSISSVAYDKLTEYNHQKATIDEQQNAQQQINELEEHQQELDQTLQQVQEQQKQLNDKLDKISKLQSKIEGLSVVTDIPPGLETYIKDSAKANDYRPELLLGIIQNESSWNYNEVSDTNDYGLCQINATNFKTYRTQIINKYGEFNEFNPYTSVDLMVNILNDFKKMYYSKYKEYPSEKSLLFAYNTGKLRQDFGGNTYTSKVLKYTSQYEVMLEVQDEMSRV
jgi:soluble lytic murein transglycosylase-like protein